MVAPSSHRGLSLVEAVLGESFNSRRRIERSIIFRGANYALESARGSHGSKPPAPIPGSGLVLRLSGLKQITLWDSLSHLGAKITLR
jgi:hypothetical protein